MSNYWNYSGYSISAEERIKKKNEYIAKKIEAEKLRAQYKEKVNQFNDQISEIESMIAVIVDGVGADLIEITSYLNEGRRLFNTGYDGKRASVVNKRYDDAESALNTVKLRLAELEEKAYEKIRELLDKKQRKESQISNLDNDISNYKYNIELYS